MYGNGLNGAREKIPAVLITLGNWKLKTFDNLARYLVDLGYLETWHLACLRPRLCYWTQHIPITLAPGI